MKSVQFDKQANQKVLLCGVCYRSYHAKQTPEFHWVTARGYIVRSIQNLLLRMNTFQLQYSVARGFLSALSLKIVPCTLSQLSNYEIMD